MTLLILAYFGGILTLLSPCILPILPFVLTRAGRPFRQNGLPLLLSMIVTFAVVTALMARGGSWAVHTHAYGRQIALILLALFGLSLCWPQLSNRLTQLFAPLAARLKNNVNRPTRLNNKQLGAAVLLGIATGLLWAPCTGPILGLILTSLILQGLSSYTFLLVCAYGLGTASSLALLLCASEYIYSYLKRFSGLMVWLKRLLGLAILLSVAIITLEIDRGPLNELSVNNTAQWEQKLLENYHRPTHPPVNFFHPPSSLNSDGSSSENKSSPPSSTQTAEHIISRSGRSINFQFDIVDPILHNISDLFKRDKSEPASLAESGHNDQQTLPDLSEAVSWINSPPLTPAQLKNKVVLIDFWTYSCINCLRSLPYVRAWHKKYKDQGLVVIGVHTPEFSFEKNQDNVAKAVRELGLTHPIAIDNNYDIWKALDNRYWPAYYFFDTAGKLRHVHFGEGEYARSEHVIQSLLAQRNGKLAAADVVKVYPRGQQIAASKEQHSPETYIGYGFRESQNFASLGGYAKDAEKQYLIARKLGVNDWGLIGHWRADPEHIALLQKGGRIVYRFYARDLHLVMGPDVRHKTIRFRVTLDGAPPGKDHGIDINADGEGQVTDQRLYQLIRQKGEVRTRLFEIEFLDPDVHAYVFTFG